MPEYLPINIPPGFRRHGVEMESAGRWRDGNLVRWEEGSVRPVGGWATLKRETAGEIVDVVVPGAEIPRGAHSWISNGGAKYLAVATTSFLYAAGVDLILGDITPVGFTAGSVGENLGYGGKKYGRSVYGTERTSDGIAAPKAVWSLDNWGEFLMACTSGDRTLYVWDLITALAEEIVAAPPLTGFVITAERFVMALGADNNPRKIAWCDREDYNVWTPAAINEAGDIELVTNGTLQAGCRVRGRTLLITTLDAHVATYQGPPIVYGFQRVGLGCGIAAPRSLVAAQFGAFWMGNNGFFGYDGSTVTELPCEVLDHVFLNINRQEIRKAWGVSNEASHEVWWFYPSAGSLECDKYVAFDYEEGHWLIGTIDRSAGTEAGAYVDPLWIQSDRVIYRHENGYEHSGVKPFLESGPINLANGDEIMYATSIMQDELLLSTLATAPLTLDVTTRYYPDGTPFAWGPYTLGNPTDVRFSGRQALLKVTAEDGAPWRLGGVKLEYEFGGRR